MIEWEETKDGIRAFDRTKTGISIDAPDWRRSSTPLDIDRPVDETVTGVASELRFPPSLAIVTDLTTGERYEHGGDSGTLSLSDSDYLVNVHGNVKTYLRFSGPATVRKTDDFDELIIEFTAPTRVTFGFRSHHEVPVDTVTVPPTPHGLATALTALSASHKTTGPDRSFPTLRGYPPRISVGNQTDVPETVRDRRKDVGIELLVPDDFDSLFVAAPLAYYLQADVKAERRDAPVLRAPALDYTYSFSPLPQFQHEAADMLRRVFFLDCLVRNAGPHSWNLAELPLLDEVEIDAEETYESSPAEQLVTYMLAPFERIDDELPDWHLSTYVDPIVDNVSSLPYMLSNLSLVYLPETSELNPGELLDASLDDFYRGAPEIPGRATARPYRRTGAGPVTSVDRVKPELHRGRVHGWLADGVPIDVFKVEPTAYENRFDYLDREGDEIEVALILNDEEMETEHESAADIYRERAEELPMDVTVREYLRRDELAGVLETPRDFVHYIGHCEEDGLRCTDGNLSVANIAESNVQTFFLNACGSYYEGMELVKKGSVAGAVTFNKVLNKQAAKVGVSFARLLMNGFSIQTAMQLSRRRIMTGKDYSVVGDGTYQLAQSETTFPIVGKIESDGDGYEFRYRSLMVRMVGSGYQPYIQDNQDIYLHGDDAAFELSRSDLRTFLEHAKMPIVFAGELCWSDEVLTALAD
ncbi:hypothetical protein [Halomicrococcus sp. NG-SE-24]|uniref:hypothetical protein n=1 Tax=Halomicrococcus sp. NG-SE-24 TaxID=3436928 RepID=UPI003D96D74D